MVLAIYAALHVTREIRHYGAHYTQNDLVVFYAWGVYHNLGGNVWTRPPGGQIRAGLGWHFCNYTPFFVLGFAPLSQLSLEHAYMIWQAIQLLSLLVALGWLTRIVTPSLSPVWTVIFVSLALASVPVEEMIRWGQATGMLLLALTLSLYGSQTRRIPMTGFGLALATLLKLFPGIAIVFFVLRRRWSVIGWTAAFFIVGVVVSGIHNWIDFATVGLFQSRLMPYRHLESSILATIQSGLALHDNLRGPRIVTLAAVLDLGVVAACSWATLKAQDDASCGLAFSLWFTAGVLLSPVAWTHDVVLVAPLALFTGLVWSREWSDGFSTAPITFWLATAVLAVAFVLSLDRPSAISGFWIAISAFVGAVLLLQSCPTNRLAGNGDGVEPSSTAGAPPLLA